MIRVLVGSSGSSKFGSPRRGGFARRLFRFFVRRFLFRVLGGR